eukprot:11186744-Lingulodinium_polyedra.AAC.1
MGRFGAIPSVAAGRFCGGVTRRRRGARARARRLGAPRFGDARRGFAATGGPGAVARRHLYCVECA